MWTFMAKRLSDDDESSSRWNPNSENQGETERITSSIKAYSDRTVLYPESTFSTTLPNSEPNALVSISTTSQPITTTFPSQNTTNSTSSPSTTGSPKNTSASTMATGDAAATAAAGAYSGGGSTSNKLAIALPVAIVGALAILALGIFVLRRRRRHQNALPSYEFAKSQLTAMSASELVSVPRTEHQRSDRSNLLRLPVPAVHVDVTDTSREMGSDLAPASASTPNDAQYGVALALPVNHRLSATQQDMRGPSSHISEAAVVPDAEVGTQTLLLSNRSRDHDKDDAVSMVSEIQEERGDRDYDDMSSVSSFNDDEHARGNRSHTFH